jgi:hypothetical protein
MAAQSEGSGTQDFETLRCKLELLEGRISRQQVTIDQLRQQVSSMPMMDLPTYIRASTSQAMWFTREWVAPMMVSVAVVTVIAVMVLTLWGR